MRSPLRDKLLDGPNNTGDRDATSLRGSRVAAPFMSWEKTWSRRTEGEGSACHNLLPMIQKASPRGIPRANILLRQNKNIELFEFF